jgi:hypothetical protein
LEYKVYSQQYLDFHLRDFPENPNLAIYEGILLREQSTFMTVYCIALEVFPETPTIAL